MILTPGLISISNNHVYYGSSAGAVKDLIYTHPANKICNGGDAGTLNGSTASQIISQAASSAYPFQKVYENTVPVAISQSIRQQVFTLVSESVISSLRSSSKTAVLLFTVTTVDATSTTGFSSAEYRGAYFTPSARIFGNINQLNAYEAKVYKYMILTKLTFGSHHYWYGIDSPSYTFLNAVAPITVEYSTTNDPIGGTIYVSIQIYAAFYPGLI